MQKAAAAQAPYTQTHVRVCQIQSSPLCDANRIARECLEIACEMA